MHACSDAGFCRPPRERVHGAGGCRGDHIAHLPHAGQHREIDAVGGCTRRAGTVSQVFRPMRCRLLLPLCWASRSDCWSCAGGSGLSYALHAGTISTSPIHRLISSNPRPDKQYQYVLCCTADLARIAAPPNLIGREDGRRACAQAIGIRGRPRAQNHPDAVPTGSASQGDFCAPYGAWAARDVRASENLITRRNGPG